MWNLIKSFYLSVKFIFSKFYNIKNYFAFLKTTFKGYPTNSKTETDDGKQSEREAKKFIASDGWLSKFKARHGMRQVRLSDEEIVSQYGRCWWSKEWHSTISKRQCVQFR